MFYEGLRLWKARFVVFCESLRFCQARCVVFYKGLRLWGGSGSNEAKALGGSAKEKPSRAWGEGEGGEARSVVFYKGLRLWEARLVMFYESLKLWEARFVVFYESLGLWGGSVSNEVMREGGSAKERPSRAWGEGEGERLDLSCFARV